MLEHVVWGWQFQLKKRNPRNLATLVHFFHQNPLYELYGILFCCQVANICNRKKLLLVSYIFYLFAENKLFILPTMNTQYLKSIWNVNLNSSCKWSSLISHLIIKQKLQGKLVVSSRHWHLLQVMKEWMSKWAGVDKLRCGKNIKIVNKLLQWWSFP